MSRAKQAVASGDFERAVSILDKIRSADPDGPRALSASRLGARTAQVHARNYTAAIQFYKHLVLKSNDVQERRRAQESIAQIYFENLQDYSQAVLEYEKLLQQDFPPADKVRFRLNLAKSQFELNNLDQATSELDALLAGNIGPDQVFDVKLLKANIQVAEKNLSGAAKVWEEILKDFPDRAKREKVALSLVVCYEELKDFNKAIETLEKMKADDPNPDFIELRIQRLKDRRSNQPGAQGWKR